MQGPDIPQSSAELRKWVSHARESSRTILRGAKGLEKALSKIEALAAKAPASAHQEDDPGPG